MTNTRSIVFALTFIITIAMTGFVIWIVTKPSTSYKSPELPNPLVPPTQLSQHFEEQIEHNPERELAKYLYAYDKLKDAPSNVTWNSIKAKTFGAAEHHAKLRKCGHHYDMNMRGPGCPLSESDDASKWVQINFLKKSRLYHLMAFDYNKDGLLYRHEIIDRFKSRIDTHSIDDCAMPQPSLDAEILFIDTFFAAGRPKVFLQDLPVLVLDLDIEEGSNPIYLIASSPHHAMVFNVIGNTARIENFSVHGNKDLKYEAGTNPLMTKVGVKGLAKEKVTILGAQCLNTYSQNERLRIHEFNKKMLESLLGRPINHSFSFKDAGKMVSIPSGKQQEAATYKNKFKETRSNLKASEITSNATFEDKSYFSEYRFIQTLVQSGALEEVAEDEYLILKPLEQYPHTPRFTDKKITYRVPKSITPPKDSLRFFNVVSHETGELLPKRTK